MYSSLAPSTEKSSVGSEQWNNDVDGLRVFTNLDRVRCFCGPTGGVTKPAASGGPGYSARFWVPITTN